MLGSGFGGSAFCFLVLLAWGRMEYRADMKKANAEVHISFDLASA